MEDTLVPTASSVGGGNICAKMENKWTWIIMGVSLLLLMAALYYLYRHIRGVSQRFQALEDVMTKVVEKTNQLQHLIQSGCMIGNAMPQPAVYQSPHPHPPQSHPQTQPPPQPPAAVVPPVNLDKELAEELKELETTTSSPPEATDKEGRVDEK